METYSCEKRNYGRTESAMLAQYFIKSKSMRYHNCTIINISRSGLALQFDQAEEPGQGQEILMEFLLPPNMEALNLRGEITRVAKDKTVCGIMFNELLPAETINRLKNSRPCSAANS